MDRRTFFGSGVVAVGSLLAAPVSRARALYSAGDEESTWLFWDLWRLDRCSGLDHRQGQAVYRPEATYVEPHIGALSAWPTVFRHGSGWRMLYSAAWKPYSLMVAHSDDGLSWRPEDHPEIQTEGEKRAPHHLYTLPSGSGGAVYLDPVAEDGFPLKVFVHQQGEPVARRAAGEPTHRWHQIAKQEGNKRYLNEEFMLVSEDGLRWQERRDLVWSQPNWHPEPPIFGFYNQRLGRHCMTVRPGWGDRRQCLQSTADFRGWSGPELLFQPDPLDRELIELYGLPVFPYGDGYVGLLWIFHCESSERTRSFNRFYGPLDCQLVYSQDGVRFSRGVRKPFIALNAAGEHAGGAIEPSCLVETDDEIRIYSSSSKVHHGRSRDANRQGVRQPHSITLHTLRKDGFMYLASGGDWGQFISKPLTILQPGMTINATAPLGEVRFQLTDLESRPVAGFTFDDCQPLRAADELAFPLRWRGGQQELVGKIVRLEVALRHAQLFAIRGHLHFIDAQDHWMLVDDKPIVPDAFG